MTAGGGLYRLTWKGFGRPASAGQLRCNVESRFLVRHESSPFRKTEKPATAGIRKKEWEKACILSIQIHGGERGILSYTACKLFISTTMLTCSYYVHTIDGHDRTQGNTNDPLQDGRGLETVPGPRGANGRIKPGYASMSGQAGQGREFLLRGSLLREPTGAVRERRDECH